MSTLKEVIESKVSVFIKPKESIIESLIRDIMTFSFLGLCIYISQDSSWWTFFTGTLMIFMLGSKIKSMFNKSFTTFNDKNAAIEYLQGLD